MSLLHPARRAVILGLLSAALLGAAACVRESESPLRVTVMVPPLAWLVSEVAGPEVVVEHLIAVGDAPETFQPTDLRITAVARSALFFRIGIPAENGPWLRALEESGTIEMVDLRQGLELRAMGTHHRGDRPGQEGSGTLASAGSAPPSDGMDPHTWLSPRRLEIMAATVASHLAAVDPRHADRYAERAAEVRTRLRDLDAALGERLAPVRGRSFFIFHPAWGYFADDYGLRQVAIEIEGKEPTEQELTQLVRQARTLGMRTLFIQPQMQSTTPAILALALGAQLETLDPLAFDLPANLHLTAERLLAAMLPQAENS